MKKIIISTVLILFGMLILESHVMKKDGAAPGYTGSPGDSLKNCTACHGGQAYNVDGWITANIPADGYQPNKTYTITASNKASSNTRFGFEVSPQNIAGELLGKMIIKDSVKTKLVGMDKYITYTAKGVDGHDSVAWSFDWIAPATGAGDVTFYGGFNANFNGQKGGGADRTYLSNLKVKENTINSIASVSKNILNFTVYPNPTNDVLNIRFELKMMCQIEIDITDLTGKKVAAILNERLNGIVTKNFSTEGLAEGTYLVRMKINDTFVVNKILVTH